MTKVDAIREVLEANNGVATLEIMYNEIEKYYPAAKNSDTWEAGLRGVLYREIKEKKNFKKIGLGLYGLIDFKEEKFEDVKEDTVRMHSYIEGICIEIGNFLNLKTFTADPSATYNKLSLSSIASLKTVPAFTYPEIINHTKKIDVLWFNDKGFQYPKRAIEVVDSIATLDRALNRTLQLLEFNLSFYILCKSEQVAKVEKELMREPYKRMRERYKVKNYDEILGIYQNPMLFKDDDFLKVETYF